MGGAERVAAINDAVLRMVSDEMAHGRRKHGPLKSPHDGYARMLGEVRELEAEVMTSRETRRLQRRSEAIQVAAVALRIALEEWRTCR